RPRLGYTLHGKGRGIADKDNVTGSTFDHLILDGSGPDLVRTYNVEENPAVARLTLTRRMSRLAPLKFGAQVIILVLIFRDEVAVFAARNVQQAVMHLEHLLRIVVRSFAFEKLVETVKVPAVEQSDHSAVVFRIGGNRRTPCYQRRQQ